MVICDTNILISAFNGRQDTIQQLHKIGQNNMLLPSLVIMELYQGMSNKKELNQMQKLLKGYNIIHINQNISQLALQLVHAFNLSHNLQIPDALIGATAVTYNMELFTYNLKDFQFMPNIRLYK